MKRLLSRAAGWMVRNRSKLPRWIDRAIESAARDPDGPVGRLASRLLGGGSGPVMGGVR